MFDDNRTRLKTLIRNARVLSILGAKICALTLTLFEIPTERLFHTRVFDIGFANIEVGEVKKRRLIPKLLIK